MIHEPVTEVEYKVYRRTPAQWELVWTTDDVIEARARAAHFASQGTETCINRHTTVIEEIK